MSYSFESRVRYSETGVDQKLTLPALVDLFQDCSTFHSEDCGLGLNYLRRMDRAWMIVFWQIEIRRMPALCETVRVGTWPYAFKGFYGLRNFDLRSADGELLAVANSVWVMMDVKEQRPAAVSPSEMAAYGPPEEKAPMEYLPRKIRRPEGCTEMEHFRVGQHHLDTNRHVNNGQYLHMAKEYLPEDFPAKRICVEYCMQAHLHDEIVPLVKAGQTEVTVMLCDLRHRPYAVVRYETEADIKA